MTMKRFLTSMVLAGLVLAPLSALAQVDHMSVVVTKAKALQGAASNVSLGAFAWDDLNKVIYTMGYTTAGADVRKVANVNAGDAGQTVTKPLTLTQLTMFYKDGNLAA